MPKSKKRRARRDPRLMTPEEIDVLVVESEHRVELMESFAESEEWKVQRARLEVRRDMLGHELAGLIRRMTRPLATQAGSPAMPPVTPEQIAYQQGRIDENADLLRFPRTAIHLWREQLAELKTIRAGAA